MSESIRLNQDDVVSMPEDDNPFEASTLKASEVYKEVREDISGSLEELTQSGMKCEVLQTTGRGWRKGKLKFSLEFIPDEPEPAQTQNTESSPPAKDASPLDDLRNELNLDK
ncbi:MAG: hypothetical protein F6K61_21465 [Sphaerospermopsis sp. SIO1G1]|nr:hypothetical protein [Sphaerospermopsis sp. SIO1G1]